MTAPALTGRHRHVSSVRTRGRIGRILTTVLMVAAVALALALGAGRVLGIRTLVEQSGSMSPVISPGDLVLTRAITAAAAAPGDIVSFRDAARGGALITHRVVSIRRTGDILAFETRGDANAAGERWTSPPGAELGRTLAILPYAGYLFGALTQPLVAACLAAIGAVLAALAAAARLTRRR